MKHSRFCDRAYLMIDGKIFENGTAEEELAANEQVKVVSGVVI